MTLVAASLSRGELVQVLPRLLRVEGGVSLVYVERKLMKPQTRAFVDWIIKHAPAVFEGTGVAGRGA